MAEGPLGVDEVVIQLDGPDRRTAMIRLARFVDEEEALAALHRVPPHSRSPRRQ
jgi:hypothetical protein